MNRDNAGKFRAQTQGRDKWADVASRSLKEHRDEGRAIRDADKAVRAKPRKGSR